MTTSADEAGQGDGRGVFVVATLLSAFLVFSVQPMVSRMLLPLFGGAAAVWSVSLAFFQIALLAGYFYAHVLTRLLPVRRAAVVHLLVLGAGALALPVAVRDLATPALAEPLRLMIILAVAIGLPFVAMSANAPLFQVWFVAGDRMGRRNPYPLYAASNLGSFAALLAYPLLIEPLAPLARQSLLWAGGYACLMAVVAVIALRLPRGGTVETRPIRVERGRLPAWLALSAVASAALVAVTQHVTTDVAAVPFLWVMPLSLYLLSFVLVFGEGRGRVADAALRLSLPVLAGLAIVVGFSVRFGVLGDLAVHLGGFFIIATACHGKLAGLRPPARELTGFYLALAAGGAVGGLSAALAAPALFSFVAEYPLVLIAGAALLGSRRWRWPMVAGVTGVLAVGVFAPWATVSKTMFRSFYAVHTIEDTRDGAFRLLRSGLEIHGVARLADIVRSGPAKPLPLAYYHLESPISEAVDSVRARKTGSSLRIGVVGLGAGAIACLAEDADTIDFFEIDPVVIRLATDPARFPFLSRCGPKVRIIEGDARRSLEASDARYDLLIVDAFSSDAIPVHLLTREAFEVYRRRTTPDGVIMLHISNNHVRLNRIVTATAASLGLAMRINDEDEDADAMAEHLYQPAVAVLARRQEDFGPLAQSEDWVAPESGQPLPAPWTDQSANLLSAVLDGLTDR